jgi:hypothetical protein
MSSAKSLTSACDFIEDAVEGVEEIAPTPNSPNGSGLHGSRAPQVRQGRRPAEWRVALPTYVRAELTAQATREGPTDVHRQAA